MSLLLSCSEITVFTLFFLRLFSFFFFAQKFDTRQMFDKKNFYCYYSSGWCPRYLSVHNTVQWLQYSSCRRKESIFHSDKKKAFCCPITSIWSERVQRWCQHVPTIKLLLLILCAHRLACTHTLDQVHLKKKKNRAASSEVLRSVALTFVPDTCVKFKPFCLFRKQKQAQRDCRDLTKGSLWKVNDSLPHMLIHRRHVFGWETQWSQSLWQLF